VSAAVREPRRTSDVGRPAVVAVADPLLIFRSGMRTLLAGEPDFALVEVASSYELERAARERQPDLALVDIDLPPDGGLAALRQFREVCPSPAILWSFEPTPEIVLDAIHAGARGCLRKEMPPEGLLRALRGVLRGEAPLARDFAALLVSELQRVGERQRARDQAATLSQREREVLELVARGAGNREIARQLYISDLTVKRHMQNILGKLRLPSRAAAAAFYRAAFETDAAA
jgi:two-component system NarL family response regulator